MRVVFLLLVFVLARRRQRWRNPGAGRSALQSWMRPGFRPRPSGSTCRRSARATPLLAWNADQPMNPASTMKLLTTLAALEVLGPAYTWRTEVYADGHAARRRAGGRPGAEGLRRSEAHLENFWLLLRDAARTRAARDPRRPGRRSQRRSPSTTATRRASTTSLRVRTTCRRMRCWSTTSRSTCSSSRRKTAAPCASSRSRSCRRSASSTSWRWARATATSGRNGRMASVDAAAARVHRRVPARLRREAKSFSLLTPNDYLQALFQQLWQRWAERSRAGCARAGARHPHVCSPPGSRLRWRRSSATSTSSATT